MSNFHRLEATTLRTPCPRCERLALELVLRCDLGRADCLRVARCTRCGTQFELFHPAPRPTAAARRPRTRSA